MTPNHCINMVTEVRDIGEHEIRVLKSLRNNSVITINSVTVRRAGWLFSPVELGLNPGEICTKLENGSYDAEFHGEQHIKSPRKSPMGKIL